MAMALPSFPVFDPSPEVGAVGLRWKKWLSRFNNLMVALDISKSERKRALLLHYVGELVNDVFDTLPNTGEAKDYELAITALNTYFIPQKNTEYEIYKFRQARQNDDESIDTYTTRLRQLSTNCEFTDEDKEIKTQIIQTCISSKLRKYALKSMDLTLSGLLQQGRLEETVLTQSAGIENSLTKNVTVAAFKHKPSNHTSKSNPVKRTCGLYGGSYPHKHECPAKGRDCRKCGKSNHFAKVCRSTNQENDTSNYLYKSPGHKQSYTKINHIIDLVMMNMCSHLTYTLIRVNLLSMLRSTIQILL
jgi:hypothetical protein